ncbi:hypothetical protein [Piscinibacter sakaiensis]|uniref:hypothetical protein n=1 Tax=Piscinibacter sakaiensis TaxID=1547922 RepID=UPI003AACDDBC
MSGAAQQHPAIELLARYRAVFAAAWAARLELAGPRRLASELAFLPAALSLQETPAHPAPRRVAGVNYPDRSTTTILAGGTWA